MKSNFNVLIIIVLCAFAFIVNNTAISTDIMESRNIVTAREMVYDGNWLVPTMNGELRLEKPVLPTWIAAVSELISPDNLALQRAMAGIAATLLVVFFYLLVVKFTSNREFGIIATLILCTSYSLILMGRTATWDIYCHAFMMVAIYFLYVAVTKVSTDYLSFVVAGFFMGLSALSKGPTSFYALLLPFIICMIIFRRGTMRKKWLALVMMLIIVAVLSSAWYIYLYSMHYSETQVVLNKESSAWISYHTKPWWYYYKFFLETGVWALLLITALIFPYWKKKSILPRKEYLFPLLWMAISLVLLSVVPEKKNRYLLPILMPASFLMGYVFVSWKSIFTLGISTKTDRIIYRVNTLLISIILMLIPFGLYFILYRSNKISLFFLITVSLAIVIIALYLLNNALKYRPYRFLYGVVTIFVFAECAILPYMGAMVGYVDNNGIGAIRSMPQMNNIPLYYNIESEEPRIEIIYDAYRKIRPLNFKDSVSVYSALPCAVLCHGELDDELPFKNGLSVELVGHFDNNRWAPDNENYNKMFIYNVYLLSK